MAADESAGRTNAELTPRAREMLERMQAIPELMEQIRESEEYFARGEPGIPWEEVEARIRERRAKHPL